MWQDGSTALSWLKTQRRLTQRNLKLLLNSDDLPLAGSTNLNATTSPDPLFSPLDREAIVNLAIENRLDLIDTQLQLSVEDLNVLFTKKPAKNRPGPECQCVVHKPG